MPVTPPIVLCVSHGIPMDVFPGRVCHAGEGASHTTILTDDHIQGTLVSRYVLYIRSTHGVRAIIGGGGGGSHVVCLGYVLVYT